MSEKQKKRASGIGPSDMDVYRTSKSYFIPWDMSASSGQNNPLLKQGFGDTQHGVAIMGYDKVTGKTTWADGIANLSGITSWAPMDPDNWALRLYSSGGRGGGNSWALRLVCDHTNKASKRSHRSTMVICQDKKQCWAFVSDLFWPKPLGTPVDDAELGFDGAGFLSMLYAGGTRGGFKAKRPVETSSGSSTKERAALMLNVSKTGGYYTDGKKAAQAHHLFFAMPEGGGNAEMQTPEEKSGTQAEEKAKDDCEEPDKWQGAMRGDVSFDFAGKRTSIAFDADYGPTDGDIATGNHFIFKPNERPPKYLPQKDKNSNHEPIDKKKSPYGLWVWVRYIRNSCPPPPQLGPMMAPGTGMGGYGTAGAGPDMATLGTVDAGAWRPPVPVWDSGGPRLVFPQGYITYEAIGIPIPEYAGDLDLRIVVPYTLPTNLSASDEMKFRLFHKKYTTSNDTIGTTWTELTKTLDSDGNPTSAAQVKWLLFEVNRIGLRAGRGGGMFFCWFARRSDDGVAKDFYLLDNLRYAFKPAGGKSPGFAGVTV